MHRHYQILIFTYLFLGGLGLVLTGDHRAEVHIEEMVELLCEVRQLGAVGILHTSGTHDSLEELTLKDNFSARVYIIWFDAQALVELFKVLLLFFVLGAARVIITLFGSVDVCFLALGPVNKVELVYFACTDQGEVVLAALVVDTVELRHAAIGRDNVRIS